GIVLANFANRVPIFVHPHGSVQDGGVAQGLLRLGARQPSVGGTRDWPSPNHRSRLTTTCAPPPCTAFCSAGSDSWVQMVSRMAAASKQPHRNTPTRLLVFAP